MALKIGELARRTGLTVRALRHYDEIGLLVPSGRSDGGYRLYSRDDVARLYRIQALRRLDLPLQEIQQIVDDPARDWGAVVARQVAQLDRDIAQASALRAHLVAVQGRWMADEEPDIGDWLLALERMAVGGKYLSDDEQRTLCASPADSAGTAAAERADLSAALHSLLASGTSPDAPQAQALARRWIGLLLEEAGGNEGLLMKLHAMHWNEPSLHALTRVDRAAMQFISQAMAFGRLARYARHCTEAEMHTLRAHYVAQTEAWPPLLAEVRQHMAAGTPPGDAAMGALARRWQALSLAKTGGDAVLHAKLQRAWHGDPALRVGSGIDDALSAYVAQATAVACAFPA